MRPSPIKPIFMRGVLDEFNVGNMRIP